MNLCDLRMYCYFASRYEFVAGSHSHIAFSAVGSRSAGDMLWYFAPDYNTALEQETIVFRPFLDFVEQIDVSLQQIAHNAADRQVGSHAVNGCHAAVCIRMVADGVDAGF